ncbi:MAG: hypothetical protein WB524_12640 [Acidobacteriaceae bacterium]
MKPRSEADNNRNEHSLRQELHPPKIGLNFTEAAGKTVAYINYNAHFPEWIALEVRFTDGTSFCFQLIPQMALRVEYLESRHGELELLKDYGEVFGGKRAPES